MIRRFVATAFAAASLFALRTADAQTLLSTGNVGTQNATGSNLAQYGQRVKVASNTTVTQFGFWSKFNGSNDVMYSIRSEDGSKLLYSQTITRVNTGDFALLFSDPFSFNLLAGQTYDFVIGASSSDWFITKFFFEKALTQSGLTLVNPGGVYLGQFPDAKLDSHNQGTWAIEIRGSSVVPEPGTYVLLATGLAALFVVRRRRRA